MLCQLEEELNFLVSTGDPTWTPVESPEITLSPQEAGRHAPHTPSSQLLSGSEASEGGTRKNHIR